VTSAVPPSVVVATELSRPPLSAAPPSVASTPGGRAGARSACNRWFCTLKQREHLHCGQCDIAFSDVRRFREHLSCAHGVTVDIDAPIDLEPTDLSGSASASTVPPPSSASVGQPASECPQLSTASAENTGGLDDDTQRYDNDNDNENGSELVIDLTSSGEGRSSSDV